MFVTSNSLFNFNEHSVNIIFNGLLLVGIVGCEQSESNKAISEYNKGVDFADREDWATAIACFDKAIQLEPYNANAYDYRGGAYIHLEEYDKAIADFTAAIRINPDFDGAYTGRGLAYSDLGNELKAAADIAKAKELGYEPDDE